MERVGGIIFFEALHHYSGHLQREMYLNRYGHSGVPILVFPSSGGSHHEFADFGMIESCAFAIEQGWVQFFTLSCVDSEAWLAPHTNYTHKRFMHEQYDKYLISEAIPFIKHRTGYFDAMIATGCSMGAFQAMNFFLRHPDVFDKVIALSGVYDSKYFLPSYESQQAEYYQHFPCEFLWNLRDAWFFEHYRRAKIFVCTGLGPWEHEGLPSFYDLKNAFASHHLPAHFETWGYDVAHDWCWWRKQLPYFLMKALF